MDILKTKDESYVNSKSYYVDILKIINDDSYSDFIKNFGDGYFFNNALHLYGFSKENEFHDLYYRNHFFKNKYSWVENINHIICFGEDIFGNQFVHYLEGFGIFFIETSEIEFISKDFSGWLRLITEDIDYYTGESLAIEWFQQNGKLEFYERLIPKKPFVLGGDYEIFNLYNKNFEYIVGFMSDIARQIHNLPNGSKIDIEIME